MRTNKLTLTKGENYSAYMPFSEACMHMRVAGKRMWFTIVGDEYPMVQLLYRPEGRPVTDQLVPFSFPITLGEGGVFNQDGEFYCYPEMNGPATPACDPAMEAASREAHQAGDYLTSPEYLRQLRGHNADKNVG